MKGSSTLKHRLSVPVLDFVENARQALGLEIVIGHGGMGRRISEAAINRCGLALAGFFNYFAYKRIQVIGAAEQSYLMSLTADERKSRLKDFCAKKVPCIVITRNQKTPRELSALSEELQIPVLRTKMITKNFVNAATIIMENLMAPRMMIQGTMVEIMGIGVLIEGKPAMGKSETALGLIKRGHALVSDDVTALRLDSSGSLIGSPVNVTRYHMEIRGLGIIHIPSLFGVASVREEKKLDLVATLCDPVTWAREDSRGTVAATKEILGGKIPQILIPVAPGRDLANIIETAALNQKLRRLGHDAAKELDEKLMALMSDGRNASE